MSVSGSHCNNPGNNFFSTFLNGDLMIGLFTFR